MTKTYQQGTDMNPHALTSLLTQLQEGRTTVTETLEKLQAYPSENLQDSCVDHHRSLRTGIPEVIYGGSKTAQQIIPIASSLLKHGEPLLATRVDPLKAKTVQKALPGLSYHRDAQMLTCNARTECQDRYRGYSMVVCAGTSDIPVAEEARRTLVTLGHPVKKLYDVGVAGLHRLLKHRPLISDATAVIVVAGMEGALPSVIAGLVSCPVIGVPTSIGYGASFGGIAALLGMLNSCAPGVAVVNIDNGFGAACMAEAINRL